MSGGMVDSTTAILVGDAGGHDELRDADSEWMPSSAR
jgi:hypothetical protein